MRDDVLYLIDELVSCYRTKLSHMSQLRNNCVAFASLSVSQDFSATEDAVSDDAYITALIDQDDFRIAALRFHICRVTGIEQDAIDGALSH
ncbi:MAG: hypothetical protein ACRCUT_04775, partial [Spirochaetota bacterium]